MFYFFYFFNALGYVCGGPLPNQVLLSRWFDKSRGMAMGIAYLGIGLGGAIVPLISNLLVRHFGWQMALRILGLLIIVLALPMALVVKEAPAGQRSGTQSLVAPKGTYEALKSLPFYLLVLGSMLSIAAVSGTQQNLKLYLNSLSSETNSVEIDDPGLDFDMDLPADYERLKQLYFGNQQL